MSEEKAENVDAKPNKLKHPIAVLRTIWHDPVWSNVITAIILGVFGVVGVYFLRTNSTTDLADRANIAPQHSPVPRCKRIITGAVQANGVETYAWFEWGETPDLGNVTTKQIFTNDTDYEMLIVGLKENATYYYRAMTSNIYGMAGGRVNSFTTSPCE